MFHGQAVEYTDVIIIVKLLFLHPTQLPGVDSTLQTFFFAETVLGVGHNSYGTPAKCFQLGFQYGNSTKTV